MKASLVVLFVVTLGGVGGIALQQHSLAQLRSENLQLREKARAADRLRQENSELASLRDTHAELIRLREETRDLHRLRNEIRRLTEQATELPALRTENASLRSASSVRSDGNVQERSSAATALTLDQMKPLGTATPEATLQTFFWAVREADHATLLNCLTPDAQARISTRSGDQLDTDLQNLRTQLRSLRVAARKQVAADLIELGVEVFPDGADAPETVSLPFQRSDNEWRLDFAPLP